MKILAKLTLIALSSLLLVPGVKATQYTQIDDYTFLGITGSGATIDKNDPLSDNFNLLSLGYNPSKQHITDASITFSLYDVPLFGGSENVVLSVDSQTLATNGSFSGVLEVDKNILGSALISLSDTGKLSFTVQATSGSFTLDCATLCADAAPGAAVTTTVPDGGTTLALLGIGLGALMVAQRKFAF